MNEKRTRQQRAEWRANAQCLDCGDYALAHNKDGTRSKYCAKHLSVHSTAHQGKRRDIAMSPQIRECQDFRDTREFKAYAALIKEWFEQHGTLTIPQINKMLGELRNDRWTWCSLDQLNLIENGAQPVRYTLYVPRAVPEVMGMHLHRAREMSA